MRIAIAHYYWDYPEPEYGLPAALVRRGNDVILTVWKGGSGEVRSYNVNGFRVYMLPGVNLASPLGWPNIKNPYVSGIGGVYDGFCPEIVDCQSHLFLTSFESQREAKKRGIPSVVTVRGVMAKRDQLTNSAQKLYIYTVASKVFRDATLVRCLTANDAAEVARYGCPQGKIRVVPNFVDTEAFRPARTTGEKILWYGRFVEEKGLAHLVRAAQSVLKVDHGASFVLAGDGPLREVIAAMVRRMGMGGSFAFPGRVDREALLSLIRESSMVVLPSLKEGMPFSLLEAMSSGKAVVASDIPGINDVVRNGESGLLVPPAESVPLARSISALRQDPELRERLGRNARDAILKGYSEEVIVGRIEEIYREARGSKA